MKLRLRKFAALALATLLSGVSTTAYAQKVTYLPPKGKEVYIPKELRDNDFSQEDSKWSYARMSYTKDVVVFWEKPFGKVLAKAPELDGHDMRVDLNNLLTRLQTFYNFYKDRLKFILPGSNADKYRMMVMLNYSLEGTAYGGDYDGVIGALWVTPNRVRDLKLNCVAHELGHSFQSQIMCDKQGEAWGGGGIFEMTSQWMLWQVNPLWTTDENYHWRDFIKKHNLRFLSGENIYHSPYVLEYWSMKRGVEVMGNMFREGKRGEDPATTYMRMFNLSLDEMSNEMTDCYSRLISFDFPRVRELYTKFVGQLTTEMDVTGKGKKRTFKPISSMIPQTWGFNVIELEVPKEAKAFTINFKGLNKNENAEYKTRLVRVQRHANTEYGEIKTGHQVKFTEKVQPGDYYLVVVGCPKNEYKPYTHTPDSEEKAEEEMTFPYEVKMK